MEPAYYRISPVNIHGQPAQRAMIVFATQGCEYARKNGGGCTMCGFLSNAKANITDEEILAQWSFCMQKGILDNVQQLDLLTLGSFLNEREISPALCTKLLRQAASLPHIQRILIESRAEYVTPAKLRECRALVGKKKLEFGIGLESADDHIRNVILNKGLSKTAFEKVIRTVKTAGCDFFAYLLIKPPHLTEKQAIEDAVASAHYVFSLAQLVGVRARVAFEPVFISQNSKLEQLFFKNMYRKLNLWSVIEVIKRTYQAGTIFVGLSDENLSCDRIPQSCTNCSQKLIDEIERFNHTQEIGQLLNLRCSCQAEYARQLEEGVI